MKAVHPGEMVRAGLVERGWTQCDLAAILGRPLAVVNRIIKGKTGISARTALELAQAFDTTPMLWLEAWNRYRLDRLEAVSGPPAPRPEPMGLCFKCGAEGKLSEFRRAG